MLQQYFSIFLFILFGLFLSVLIYFLSFFLIQQKGDTEKLAPYECGFDPYDDARKVFDVRFYLISIFFIVFDLESVFIFPWVVTLDSNSAFAFWTMVEFLIELIVGYAYIWLIGALEWE